MIRALAFTPFQICAQETGNNIRIDQLGYYPDAPKIAMVIGAGQSASFSVIEPGTGDTVYRGNLGPLIGSRYSGLRTRKADFSAFTRTGRFAIAVPGIANSYPFEIGKGVYHGVATASLKGFYFQRASMALPEAYAGKWARAAGHPDTSVFIHPSAVSAFRPAGTVISCPGGWYDAGDYNKYIVNSGITVGTLLSAYEDFPAYFDSVSVGIPKTVNRVPDILQEVLYNLRWMLRMQDPSDGGVYHKCTNAGFDGMIMPSDAMTQRWVVQKGTAAALDFAAVAAQASRIFKKYEQLLPGLADSCTVAALKAWEWAQKNPAVKYDQQALNSQYLPKITTGAYGDRNFEDEFFWAACELAITTREKPFLEFVVKNAPDSLVLPSWNQVAMLGYYSLLRFPADAKSRLRVTDSSAARRILRLADRYLTYLDSSAFHSVMGQSRQDFVWGSNAVAANQGTLLVKAYLLTHDTKYLQAAASNLHYLLGRNATGYCFVTGEGSRSPMHPHHRPSVADGIPEPVPGLLVGGPNPGRQDRCHYDFMEPETSYVDSDCAYASNEIAINWNAPLVYLVNALEALQYRAGFSPQKEKPSR
jgi:endoglucanase